MRFVSIRNIAPSIFIAAFLLSVQARAEVSTQDFVDIMTRDALWAYDYGFANGVCKPDQTGLSPESREYNVLLLYPGPCALGAQDRTQGEPVNRDFVEQEMPKIIRENLEARDTN